MQYDKITISKIKEGKPIDKKKEGQEPQPDSEAAGSSGESADRARSFDHSNRSDNEAATPTGSESPRSLRGYLISSDDHMSIIFELAGAAVIFAAVAIGKTWWTTAALILVGIGFLVSGIIDIVKLKRGK